MTNTTVAPKKKRIIASFEPVYHEEGYYHIILKNNKMMQVPFFDILSFVCVKDKALDQYLTKFLCFTENKGFNIYNLIKEVLSLGYDIERQLNLYLIDCEDRTPGYLEEFSYTLSRKGGIPGLPGDDLDFDDFESGRGTF